MAAMYWFKIPRFHDGSLPNISLSSPEKLKQILKYRQTFKNVIKKSKKHKLKLTNNLCYTEHT